MRQHARRPVNAPHRAATWPGHQELLRKQGLQATHLRLGLGHHFGSDATLYPCASFLNHDRGRQCHNQKNVHGRSSSAYQRAKSGASGAGTQRRRRKDAGAGGYITPQVFNVHDTYMHAITARPLEYPI